MESKTWEIEIIVDGKKDISSPKGVTVYPKNNRVAAYSGRGYLGCGRDCTLEAFINGEMNSLVVSEIGLNNFREALLYAYDAFKEKENK